MPNNTAGGWPYPLPTEPVRDGAGNIQALATKDQERLNKMCVFGGYLAGNFDSNGLFYAPTWASMGVTWTQTPFVAVTPLVGTTGNDTGAHIQIYQPQNSATAAVFMAYRVSTGAIFNAALAMYVIAVGEGKWN